MIIIICALEFKVWRWITMICDLSLGDSLNIEPFFLFVRHTNYLYSFTEVIRFYFRNVSVVEHLFKDIQCDDKIIRG